jgi:hypothetical protein
MHGAWPWRSIELHALCSDENALLSRRVDIVRPTQLDDLKATELGFLDGFHGFDF